MEKPIISVIIPTLNEERCLKQCLAALKKQKADFLFEVIVVDHQSTDSTRVIAKQYHARVILENRRGTAVARQTGVTLAKASLLAFTEADCVPPENWLTMIVNYFRDHPSTAGVVGSYYYDGTGELQKGAVLLVHRISNRIFRFLHGQYPFRGTNCAVRKKILLQAGGFREDKAPFDDADAGERVAKIGKVDFLPSLIVTTSPRRIRRRLHLFLWEFLISYIRVYWLGHKGNIRWYESVR